MASVICLINNDIISVNILITSCSYLLIVIMFKIYSLGKLSVDNTI